MKNLFIAITLVMFTSTALGQNYSFFENDVRLPSEGNVITTLTHFGFFPINDKFGITDYASIEGNDEYSYGQLMLGGYYNITNELSAYLMVGKESSSNQVRLGYMVYYITGDNFRGYFFYNRNQNPLSSETKETEWFDIMTRFAIVSKPKNSFYIGGRYLTNYGLGMPLTVRQTLNGFSNIYVAFTPYYDVDLTKDWLPTISLIFEFL